MEGKRLKYIIYCRKSSEREDKQALSIEAQKRELIEYADRGQLEVLIVLEESQSAYKLGRPIFDKMMRLIEDGVAGGILTWKPDRLARNALDGGRVIQAMDDKKLQEIRTPYEILRQEENRMILYLYFGMSNDVSRQISANVKRGNRQKYARGEFVGKAPLGYLNSKDGISRNIIPDPEKAPFVRKLFEEFADGRYSVVNMANKADEWGLKSIHGHRIAKSGMYILLQRTAYYGVFQHGGESHQGSYEPIITKQLFDEVQAVLHNRSKPRAQEHEFAYTGLMRCGNCGCAITATEKKKYYKRTNNHAIYVYYHCTKRKGNCGQEPVTLPELESQFNDSLVQVSIDKDVWELGIKLLQKKYDEELKLQGNLRKQWQQEYNKVQDDLEKLLKMRMREEITGEEYLSYKKELLDNQVRVKEKLGDNEEGSKSWLELVENFFNTAYQARQMLNSEDLEAKRKAIADVGWNLILRNKKVQFSFKEPFNILLQPQYRSDVQGQEGSNLYERFWRPPCCHYIIALRVLRTRFSPPAGGSNLAQILYILTLTTSKVH